MRESHQMPSISDFDGPPVATYAAFCIEGREVVDILNHP
jgi:hypothetical protein